MHTLVIVLRIIHILGGVFWVGSALFTTLFLSPAVAASPEAGQRIMAHLAIKAQATLKITAASFLTVLSGASLYWIDSQGFTSMWTSSGPGIGFGAGALLALVGMAFGLLVGKNSTVLGRLASEIKGQPTPDQLKTIQAARRQMAYAGPVSTAALVLALALMATARYWVF